MLARVRGVSPRVDRMMDSVASLMGADPPPSTSKGGKHPAPKQFLRSLKVTKYAKPDDLEAAATEGGYTRYGGMSTLPASAADEICLHSGVRHAGHHPCPGCGVNYRMHQWEGITTGRQPQKRLCSTNPCIADPYATVQPHDAHCFTPSTLSSSFCLDILVRPVQIAVPSAVVSMS